MPCLSGTLPSASGRKSSQRTYSHGVLGSDRCDQAINLRPAFADLYAKLGALHRDRGQLDAAKAAFEAACEANPSYVHARVQLGVTLFMLDRKPESVDAFREALSIDETNKIAAIM